VSLAARPKMIRIQIRIIPRPTIVVDVSFILSSRPVRAAYPKLAAARIMAALIICCIAPAMDFLIGISPSPPPNLAKGRACDIRDYTNIWGFVRVLYALGEGAGRALPRVRGISWLHYASPR